MFEYTRCIWNLVPQIEDTHSLTQKLGQVPHTGWFKISFHSSGTMSHAPGTLMEKSTLDHKTNSQELKNMYNEIMCLNKVSSNWKSKSKWALLWKVFVSKKIRRKLMFRIKSYWQLGTSKLGEHGEASKGKYYLKY